jgi:hypothetical protein
MDEGKLRADRAGEMLFGLLNPLYVDGFVSKF